MKIKIAALVVLFGLILCMGVGLAAAFASVTKLLAFFILLLVVVGSVVGVTGLVARIIAACQEYPDSNF